jgi:hypothetical protein
MCCGSRRAALRNAANSSRAPASGAPAPQGVPTPPRETLGGVTLRYAGNLRSVMRVKGPITGQAYEFSAAPGGRTVDAKDAAALMRSGLFLRA